MDYKKIYTENYFNGKDSFFYRLGYGRFAKFYFDNLFRQLKPSMRNLKQGRVLDVGCAYGFILRRFPDAFERYGIDVSDYAIKEAKKRLPNAVLKVGNIEDELPFPNEFFDIIVCSDVIEHLENPSRALENIRRVLKKNGILYLNTPNLNWLRKNFLAYADKKEHHISMFSHRDLFYLLTKINFKIKDRWTYASLLYFFFIKFRSNLGIESAFICGKS